MVAGQIGLVVPNTVFLWQRKSLLRLFPGGTCMLTSVGHLGQCAKLASGTMLYIYGTNTLCIHIAKAAECPHIFTLREMGRISVVGVFKQAVTQ